MRSLSISTPCGAGIAAGKVYNWGHCGGKETPKTPIPHEPYEVKGIPKMVMVRTARRYTCGLSEAGEVWCWGPGTGGVPVGPVKVKNMGAVSWIAPAQDRFCAVAVTGQLWCWLNKTPKATKSVDGVRHMGLSNGHTCAALDTGAVQCWGQNGKGQLGDGTTDKATSTTSKGVLTVKDVEQVCAGLEHACGMSKTGEVWCWGDNTVGQLGVFASVSKAAGVGKPVKVPGISDAKALVCGLRSTCIVHANGEVSCWGEGAAGTLGVGNSKNTFKATRLKGLKAVGSISLHHETACIRHTTGGYECWGAGNDGQLLTYKALQKGDFRVPTPITGTFGALFGGSGGGCATNASNKAMSCWGHNEQGQAGNGFTSDLHKPGKLGYLKPVLHADRSFIHGCAIFDLGAGGKRVHCWGNNEHGQVTAAKKNQPLQQLKPKLLTYFKKDALRVAVGQHYTCALLAEKTVRCWGSQAEGRIGNGATTGDSEKLVTIPGLSKVTDLSTGTAHSCAVLEDGSVKCWGRGGNGQLGDGLTKTSAVPVAVKTTTKFVQVAAGSVHTCAREDKTGLVWCWGATTDKKDKNVIGNKKNEGSPVPVAVSGLPATTWLSVSHDHSCAVDKNGDVWCWGNNYAGALGVGHTITSVAGQPIKVKGLSGKATRVETISHATCALVGKTVSCWGDGTRGKTGTGYWAVLSPQLFKFP